MWSLDKDLLLLQLHDDDNSDNTLMMASIIMRKPVSECLSRVQVLKEQRKRNSRANYVLEETRRVKIGLMCPKGQVNGLTRQPFCSNRGASILISSLAHESLVQISALEIFEGHSPVELTAKFSFSKCLNESGSIKFVVSEETIKSCLDPVLLHAIKKETKTDFVITRLDSGLLLEVSGCNLRKAFVSVLLSLRKHCFLLSDDEGLMSPARKYNLNLDSYSYVLVGGLDEELSKSDFVPLFEQFGKVVHMVGIAGFAFIGYEDKKSCNLAVQHLDGFQLRCFTLRVDVCENIRLKKELATKKRSD